MLCSSVDDSREEVRWSSSGFMERRCDFICDDMRDTAILRRQHISVIQEDPHTELQDSQPIISIRKVDHKGTTN